MPSLLYCIAEGDAFGADVRKCVENKSINEIIDIINEPLAKLGFTVKFTRDEVHGRAYYAFVNIVRRAGQEGKR